MQKSQHLSQLIRVNSLSINLNLVLGFISLTLHVLLRAVGGRGAITGALKAA